MAAAPSPVLLLIDWQKGFEEIAARTPRSSLEAETNARRLLTHWRDKGWPVIHVLHDSVNAGSVFRPGRSGNAPIASLEPEAGEPVLRKSVNSAFIGTDLAARLDRLGRPVVVVTGQSTDHCVTTSVRMGANLGYRMIVAGDATATFDRIDLEGQAIPAETVQRVHLASLNGEFAAVMPTPALLALGPGEIDKALPRG